MLGSITRTCEDGVLTERNSLQLACQQIKIRGRQR